MSNDNLKTMFLSGALAATVPSVSETPLDAILGINRAGTLCSQLYPTTEVMIGKRESDAGVNTPFLITGFLYEVGAYVSDHATTFRQILKGTRVHIMGIPIQRDAQGHYLTTRDANDIEHYVLVTDENGEPLEPTSQMIFSIEWGSGSGASYKRSRSDDSITIRGDIGVPRKMGTNNKGQSYRTGNIDWSSNPGLENKIKHPILMADLMDDKWMVEEFTPHIPVATNAPSVKAANKDPQNYSAAVESGSSGTITEGNPFDDEPGAEEVEGSVEANAEVTGKSPKAKAQASTEG